MGRKVRDARESMKNMSVEEFCDYLYNTDNLLKVQGCPVEATETGELTMYCPDGRVFHDGEEVYYSNPVIDVYGKDITLPLIEMAKETGLDMLIATPVKFVW